MANAVGLPVLSCYRVTVLSTDLGVRVTVSPCYRLIWVASTVSPYYRLIWAQTFCVLQAQKVSKNHKFGLLMIYIYIYDIERHRANVGLGGSQTSTEPSRSCNVSTVEKLIGAHRVKRSVAKSDDCEKATHPSGWQRCPRHHPHHPTPLRHPGAT